MSATSTALKNGDSGARKRANGNGTTNGQSKLEISAEGRKTDELLDKHGECVPRIPFAARLSLMSNDRYEFGGPWGVAAMMTGFPLLMYYLWICLWFYDGTLVYPTSVDGIQPFLWKMWEHVRDVRIASPFISSMLTEV